MKISKQYLLGVSLLALLIAVVFFSMYQQRAVGISQDISQAQTIFTVAESKRLIAKAVAQMPIVKKALTEGMVIICHGTTNTYVAEEIIGEKIEHMSFVFGKVKPEKNAKKYPEVERIGPVVLIKGQRKQGISLEQALEQLKPGDVVIKGANALDYNNQTAGIIVGSSAGTIGKAYPKIVGKKAHLIIPIGLEKQIAGNVVDITRKMRQPVDSIGKVNSMFMVTGHIVTEIEAMKLLADVDAFQAAAGGIGGAEGVVWIILRGEKTNVEKALKIAKAIHGEPPF
jgi:hypothetical protein